MEELSDGGFGDENILDRREGMREIGRSESQLMKTKGQRMSRRAFMMRSTGAIVGASALGEWGAKAVEKLGVGHQATGVRAGEMTEKSAVIWVRMTGAAGRNEGGRVIASKAETIFGPVADLEGACPGVAGRVRVRYGPAGGGEAVTTEWVEVGMGTDFTHHFRIEGLKAGTDYEYESETVGLDGEMHGTMLGKFRTAPGASTVSEVSFCVMTCQGYPDRGHPDGHGIYPAMLALKPSFACLTGDLVYYDNDPPRATSPELARYHWQRMFSLPRLVEFNRQVGTYWLKDDHDTLSDDAWPGQKMGSLTFAEGQRIFREQAPMGGGMSYRTIRWGRDLQIWLTEGRDFRSPNKQADGPEKTIWGVEQKAWFQRTVKESDATWKVLISPTPLVGPDRRGKNDNHANAGYAHEGEELRAWIQANVADHFFVICGDRHWQYHSVHPETGLHEFSVGAASDEHAGGSPGENPRYHRFHRVKGGFLAVKVKRVGEKGVLSFEHRDLRGAVVYEWSAERKWVDGSPQSKR